MKNLKFKILASMMLALSGGALSGCYTTVYYSDPYRYAWYDVYGYPCDYSYGYGCYYYDPGYGDWWYWDDYYGGNWGYYDDWGWYYGYPLMNDRRGSEGRDLVAEMERMENEKSAQAGQRLAEKYALAEETGVQIAKTLQDYATLGRKRERTDADMAEFSKRLFGVKLDDAQKALKEAEKGNFSEMLQLNEAVADHWGTSPETSRAILTDWYGKDSK